VTDSAPRQVTRVSAYAVCVDESRRLLLCRIAAGGSVGFDGWWTLPGGGLDHGEDPRAGALREVDSWHTDFTTLAGERQDYHGIRVLFRCRIVGGEPRDELDGSTDTCRWFTPAELATERLVDIAQLAVRLVRVA